MEKKRDSERVCERVGETGQNWTLKKWGLLSCTDFVLCVFNVTSQTS